MRTRITVLSLCVFVLPVCWLHIKSIQHALFSMAIGFSLGLSDFQLTDLSKMPAFMRKSAFHDYFVLSNPYKQLCILFVVERSRGTRSLYIEHTFMYMACYLLGLG